jgi:hypothetical protein
MIIDEIMVVQKQDIFVSGCPVHTMHAMHRMHAYRAVCRPSCLLLQLCQAFEAAACWPWTLLLRSFGLVARIYCRVGKMKLITFFPLVLGGIIENQNSDFVMTIDIKPSQLYVMTKSEF